MSDSPSIRDEEIEMRSIIELRLEEEARSKPRDPVLSSSEGEAPVELRPNPTYPLLVDPDQSVAAEHFGVIRTRLLNARAQSGTRSVIVTSAHKQEGKTFNCLNISISVAQLSSTRVLLVDGDLRMKGISRFLGLEKSAGVADFLRSRKPFRACVRSTTLPYLSVAPAGDVPVDAVPGILEGPRFAEFLEESKQEFGLIIVDSVPVAAPVADFELLLAACDAALLVVHLRKTTREGMDISARRLDGKLLGIVVNNTELRIGSDADPYYRAKGGK